jgi:hypothetical protein
MFSTPVRQVQITIPNAPVKETTSAARDLSPDNRKSIRNVLPLAPKKGQFSHVYESRGRRLDFSNY